MSRAGTAEPEGKALSEGAATSEEPAFRRVLGTFDATCVVIGAIIGVGIFFNPGRVARMAGSPEAALLVWMLGGGVALLGALTFAELGRAYPRAGGQYDVLRDAYGPVPAFLYVFCNLTAVQSGAVAIIAIIAVDNLFKLFGGSASGLPATIAAHAIIWALVAANVTGVRSGSRIQNLTVAAKLAAIAMIVVLALLAPRAPGAAPPVTGSPAATLSFGTLFAGLMVTMFSYGGWQQALWMGGEIADARRRLPRALVAGVAVVVLSYLAVNWSYFALLGYEGVKSASPLAAAAAERGWPGMGGRLIALGVAVSALGVLNAQFLAGPRLTWAMARDGRFFRAFASVNARTGTPIAAILLLGAFASGLLLATGSDIEALDKLVAWVVVVDALFFALTALAYVRHWRRHPGQRSRGTAFLAIPVAFALLELAAVAGTFGDASVRNAVWFALAWVAAAFLCYPLASRRARSAA